MSITVIWQPPDLQIMAMNTAIINLADEGMIYEKYIIYYEIFILDLRKMFKTMNIHFKGKNLLPESGSEFFL